MNKEEAGRKLVACLEQAIRSIGTGSAIAFSGGIDSTLLLHLSGYRLKPYTVGMQGSRDFENAEFVSGRLGFKTDYVKIGPDDVERAVRAVRYIDPDISAAEAGYETVLYLTLSSVSQDTVITGQGSDELFYGYRKFLDGVKSNAGDMEKLFTVTLPREYAIAESLGKTLVTPYLSPCVLDFSKGLTRDDCISDGQNKLVVRMAAELSGLPEEIAYLPKKAAQYGSGVQKLIKKKRFFNS